MSRKLTLVISVLFIAGAGFVVGLFTPRSFFFQPEAIDTTKADEKVKKLLIVTFRLDVGLNEPGPSLVTEIENFNENLRMFIEKNTCLQLLPFTAEVDKKHGKNPIAAGNAVGADAVLTGVVVIDNFVTSQECVNVNMLDTRTGKAIWSTKLVLRESNGKDRGQVFPRLQQAPGDIGQELRKRWPKKD